MGIDRTASVTHQHCGGIDVHKKTVVVCFLSKDETGKSRRETHTYSTTTAELLRRSEWLATEGVMHIAMESPGKYWKPVHNLLESSCEVMVVNSHHFKQAPGRKTNVKVTEWLANMLSYGLVQVSFIPQLFPRPKL